MDSLGWKFTGASWRLVCDVRRACLSLPAQALNSHTYLLLFLCMYKLYIIYHGAFPLAASYCENSRPAAWRHFLIPFFLENRTLHEVTKHEAYKHAEDIFATHTATTFHAIFIRLVYLLLRVFISKLQIFLHILSLRPSRQNMKFFFCYLYPHYSV